MAPRFGMTHDVGTPEGRVRPLPKPESVVTRLLMSVPAGGEKIVSFWFTRRNSKVSNLYFL
jgi:hypothetical protein